MSEQQEYPHLDDFADSFLAKCTFDQMISRCMSLIASEQKLMMRPRQVRKPSWAATTKLQAANFKTSPL
jgi:type I site-specific restriction-modification system R (restriction) subunit